ncbi:MAG: autotransporter-associated beta strand repeat-containing protein [Kiritimatiellae bacterium]|nr:autotransporter-associated beta strand repeat-containing protein [Kiritimatiellia bacterium]
MNMRQTVLMRSMLSITFAGIVFQAQAVSYVWDTAPGIAGVGDGTVTGGTGNWNTGTGNWTTDGGTNNVAWPGSGTDNNAVFGDTPGTVTLSAAGVAANGLTFNTGPYTVTNATLTLNGTTPTVTVGSDVSVNMYSIIAGTAGLVKEGAGVLTLCTTNRNFSGTVVINGGTLTLNAPNPGSGAIGAGLNSAPIIVNNGGTLIVSNNWLISSWEPVTVNSGGTLTFPKFGPGEIDCHYMNKLTLTDARVNGDGQFRWGNGTARVTVNAGSAGTVISATINLVKWSTNPVAILDVADGDAPNDLTISSSIRDVSPGMSGLPLIKTGLGTMLMTGTNTYVGPTLVSNGTLLVNGSLATTNTGVIFSSATLGGTGRLSGTFTLNNGATLTPGDPATGGGIGTLTFCNLTLSNIWHQCDYGAASSDRVTVTNALTLPDRLTVCLSPVGGAPLPTELVLFSASTLTRTPDFAKWDIIGCEGSVAVRDNTNVVLTITGGDANTLYYWDVNGSATGAGGQTPSGSWDGASAVWNTDFYGGAGLFTNLTSTADLLCFSAGSDATGAYLVDLDGGTRTASALLFKNGLATLTNGTVACGVFDVRTGTADLRAAVSGTGTPLVKKGAGNLSLAGDNTCAEGLVISQGQVTLNHTNAPGSGQITLGDANSGDAPVTLCANVPGQRIMNPIVVTAEGTGPVAINGTAKTLEYRGPLTLNRPTTLGGYTGDRYVYRGKISGNVGVLTFDSDRITLDQGSSADANTFVGRVVVNPGKILQPNNIFALSPSHAVEVNGTVQFAFGWGTRVFTTGTLTGTGRVKLASDNTTNHTATVQIGGDNGSGTFNGTLSNCDYNKSIMSLQKAGTGVQTLANTNTYSGPTTISAGTLKLGVADALTNSAITVASGATLDLGGKTQHVKALAGTGGTLRVNIAEDGIGSDQVIFPGDLNLAGLALEIAGVEHLKPSETYLFASSSGGIRNGVFAQAAVPEKWFILYTPAGAQLEFQRGTLFSVR